MRTLLTIVLILFPCIAFGLSFTETGSVMTVTYNEPVTNADGSDLDDLDHVSFYYNMNDSTGDMKAVDVPASSPNGGGKDLTATFEIPVKEGMQRNVDFWGAASDKSGNESIRSEVIQKRIDRLAPDTIH